VIKDIPRIINPESRPNRFIPYLEREREKEREEREKREKIEGEDRRRR